MKVTLNSTSHWVSKKIKQFLLFWDLSDVLNISLIKLWLLLISEKGGNSGCDQDCTEICTHTSRTAWSLCSVDACDWNSITRLNSVNEIIFEYNLNRARKLTRRGSFWHFLNGNHLWIFVNTVSILSRERVIVLVLSGHGIIFVANVSTLLSKLV